MPRKKRDDGYPPGPLNCFMVFLNDPLTKAEFEARFGLNAARHRKQLTKWAGSRWKEMECLGQQDAWKEEAEYRRAAHALQYPGFRRRPRQPKLKQPKLKQPKLKQSKPKHSKLKQQRTQPETQTDQHFAPMGLALNPHFTEAVHAPPSLVHPLVSLASVAPTTYPPSTGGAMHTWPGQSTGSYPEQPGGECGSQVPYASVSSRPDSMGSFASEILHSETGYLERDGGSSMQASHVGDAHISMEEGHMPFVTPSLTVAAPEVQYYREERSNAELSVAYASSSTHVAYAPQPQPGYEYAGHHPWANAMPALHPQLAYKYARHHSSTNGAFVPQSQLGYGYDRYYSSGAQAQVDHYVGYEHVGW